jgi:hypothetical protein
MNMFIDMTMEVLVAAQQLNALQHASLQVAFHYWC